MPSSMPKAQRHSRLEDAHALLMGSSFCAFGLVLLKACGLVTGGVAGIALVLAYVTGWPVGALFVLINLPFLLLAQRRMGWLFTIKSLLAMTVLAALSIFIPKWLQLDNVEPVFAAVFGGSLIGMGVLSLARHKSSVGGIGILALYLQEQRGWSAGLVQMIADASIVGASLVVIGPSRACLSLLSGIALNIVMIAYHRPGRYAGH